MKLNVRCLWPALCAALLLSASATALTLSPMRAVLSPSGTDATSTFRVHNNSKSRVAVEFTMAHREVDIDGKESNPPADADFMLYPMQVVLDPDEARTVKVTWIGDPQPSRELAYRLICEQLPVELTTTNTGKAQARIKLMMRYIASVYILPKGARPGIVVDAVSAVEGPDGKPRIELVLLNVGNAHQMLKDVTLHLTPGDADTKTSKSGTVKLTDEDLKGLAGTNMLAGTERRFSLPWPDGLPQGPLQVELDFGKAP